MFKKAKLLFAFLFINAVHADTKTTPYTELLKKVHTQEPSKQQEVLLTLLKNKVQLENFKEDIEKCNTTCFLLPEF